LLLNRFVWSCLCFDSTCSFDGVVVPCCPFAVRPLPSLRRVFAVAAALFAVWLLLSAFVLLLASPQNPTAHAPNSKRNVLIPIGISAAFYAGCMWYSPQVTVSRQNHRKTDGRAALRSQSDLEARP
jgi:hypothetical protein